jgi:hypothetical protein
MLAQILKYREQRLGRYILKPRLPVQGYRTVEDLLSISIEDLEDVGFFKLGHQKRLLLGMRRVRELKRGMPTHVAQVQVHSPLSDTNGTALYIPYHLILVSLVIRSDLLRPFSYAYRRYLIELNSYSYSLVL